MIATAILLASIIVALLWSWLRCYNYWEKKGFPFLKGSFPFGTKKDMTLVNRYSGHLTQILYKRLEPNPYGGIYIWHQPFLLARDPDTIRTLMIKDFQYFRDRGRIQTSPDIPLSENLFDINGDKWHAVRVKLSPSFSSGRLKHMYTTVFESCAINLDKELEKLRKTNQVIDVKNTIKLFTLDTVTSCAFGLAPGSIENLQFRKASEEIFLPYLKLITKIQIAMNTLVPFVGKVLKLPILPKKFSDFILPLVKNTVKYREKHNIKRNDFLDLMIQLKNRGSLELDRKKNSDVGEINDPDPFEFTDDLLASQCFVFFAAGFETSSSVQTYALYELALNLEIQDRLHKEIDQVIERHGGTVNYDALQEMTFMEQVVSETMRKYPTVPVIHRQCIKSFSMPDHPKRIVEKGTKILIPVYALHHDPKYFPDPDRFDPERFSNENKSKLVPYTYLPFGEGPRQCIGKRFGLLQTKLGLSTVLRKYKVLPTNETPIKLNFVPTLLISASKEPIKLLFTRRDEGSK